MKWSWAAFFTKLTSRKFWVWIVTTLVTFAVLEADGDHAWITPVIIVWGVISFIYLCGEVIIDALGKAIEKANIKFDIGGKA
jgi:threonine/homoserine/homoserine lactone efflux protein